MSGILTASGPVGFILQLPPVTRSLALLLLAASTLIQLLRLSLDAVDLAAVFRGSTDDTLAFPWLVVVPGYVIWKPWTLVTAAFTEVGLIELIFSLVTLLMCGRYLERVWGSLEFLKFCLVTVVLSNIMSIAVNIVEHIVLRGTGLFLFGMSYHGMMALQTGFLVAFTQLIPEHQVQLFGLFKVRVKKLPMAYVGISNVMCIIGYQSPFILIQMGWLVSWWWLRFVKMGEGGEFRGDRSETFSFASWFPSPLQGPIRKVCDLVFGILVKLHILKSWTSDLESGNYSTLPGGARAEAERRRAMALKALDQRLATNSTTSKPPNSNNSNNVGGGGGGSGVNLHTVGTGDIVFEMSEELRQKEKE